MFTTRAFRGVEILEIAVANGGLYLVANFTRLWIEYNVAASALKE